MTTAAEPSLTVSLTLEELRGIKLIAENCLAKPRDGGSPEGATNTISAPVCKNSMPH